MPVDQASGDFGRKLREARERRGVSLRQIANATKISVSALEALERNDISRLPGGIFSRAFVRSYAVEVGLDPEETIREFIAQFPQDSVTAGHPTTSQVEDHQAVESDRRMATTFVRLIALSIPIAGALVYFGTVGRKVEPRAAPPASAATAPAPEPEVPPPPPPSAVGVVAAAAPRADVLAVRLSVMRPCWVSATVDGRLVIERLMQAGEGQTVEVRRELVLTAGDAAALTLRLNGVATKPIGGDGQVVTLRLNLTNFKEYLQNQ